jgi:hypothetical protein
MDPTARNMKIPVIACRINKKTTSQQRSKA